MPFSSAFENYGLIERIRRWRSSPVRAYGTAVAAVALATVVRWLVDPQLLVGLPFITYYPAIIVATLVGGLWPGLLSLALCAAAAWYWFLPPFDWELQPHAAFSLLFFALLSSVNVAVIWILDVTIDRVLAQERNMRVLIESAPNGILVVDAAGNITLVNPSMEKLFGYTQGELLGKTIDVLVAAEAEKRHAQLRHSYMQEPEARAMGAGRDLSGRRKDGSEFPVEIGLNPISSDGKTAILATVIDITERQRAQESQRLVVRELEHRTRNLFAVFQALASRALDEGRTAAEAKYVLNGRLQALAKAYAMLADAAWEGVSLFEILDRQFAGFSQRLEVSGCEVMLSPSAAQQFALIVHELATNALKYGALSAAEGRLSIQGRIEHRDGEDRFSFLWLESGGPPVLPPTRKGFGSVILIDAAKQFGESVAMNFEPQGVSYELAIPLSAIEVSTKKQGTGKVIGLRAG
jgi:PAS domain S-box-containing protein